MVRLLTGRGVLLMVTAAVLLCPAAARAELGADFLGADLKEVGMVRLGYAAPVGTQVQFFERVGDRLKALGESTATAKGFTSLVEAGRWRCDRLVRRFAAAAIEPDGSRTQDLYDVRTPSCANRLRLSLPHRVVLGATVGVRVKDRWKNGGTRPRLCITPPRGRRACRVLIYPRAVDLAGRRFRASKRGVWRVELSLRGHRVRGTVAVGTAHHVSQPRLPAVLMTGDSTAWGIDGFLGDRLARTATVGTDVHPGSGVSHDQEWVTRAATQAKRFRPRTTVISLGALEGYAMETPDGTRRACCDALWAAEYTRRARLMMKTYIRRGRGHVLWLASPAPRNLGQAAITGAVNLALVRAAEGLSGARILRLDELMTPNGYRESMHYRGQTVRVRQSDGVHFTVAGTAIAAAAIEKELRAAPGWLSPGR